MTEYQKQRSLLELFTTRQNLGIDDGQRAFLEWLTLEDLNKQAKYRNYREYYDGEHAVMLTDRQKKFLELATGQQFSANFCPLVVDELERRMLVSGFDAEGNKKVGGPKGVLWRWWRMDNMDADQSDTHLSAIRDGDSYVIVAWNDEEERPEFHHNMAYDGTEGVAPYYSDETGKLTHATKRWLVTNTGDQAAGIAKRMNVYYPDRVERYIADGSHGGDFYPYTLDGKPGVIDWSDPITGKPFGIAVHHLKYKSGGYRMGKSILEDVIPLQNGLNKALVDVVAAADTTGFRLYWATGTDMTDENDEPLQVHPGTFLTSTSPDSRFGFIPGEDLRPLIEVVDMWKVSIAQVSETPMHLFQVSGQNASEGAQKQQEVGMINKATYWGRSVGNMWEQCMQQSILLSNAYAGTSYPTDLIVQTLWEDAEVRDKTTRRGQVATTAKTWVDAGASLEEAAIEAGVSEDRAKSLGKIELPRLSPLAPGQQPMVPGQQPAAQQPVEREDDAS